MLLQAVSSLVSKGKKTALETWMAYAEATETFFALSHAPQKLDTTTLLCWNDTRSFYMTDRTSNLDSIDEALQYMFTKRRRSMDAIPPTKAALVQHTSYLSSLLLLEASFRYTP